MTALTEVVCIVLIAVYQRALNLTCMPAGRSRLGKCQPVQSHRRQLSKPCSRAPSQSGIVDVGFLQLRTSRWHTQHIRAAKALCRRRSIFRTLRLFESQLSDHIICLFPKGYSKLRDVFPWQCASGQCTFLKVPLGSLAQDYKIYNSEFSEALYRITLPSQPSSSTSSKEDS